MPTVKFSVDSALLRELGERLVGHAHIALAELIKNSYDADATAVTITFENDVIEVTDNGHGMTEDEFRSFWMRIGSPHKERQQRSRKLGRPLTGSKGVGRLAAQFLAQEVDLITRSNRRGAPEISASVDWDEAIKAGDLTEAEAHYDVLEPETTYAAGARSGTFIRLSGLKHDWTADRLKDLAQELWPLRPPFRASSKTEAAAFDVELITADPEARREFTEQMEAILKIWYARIVARLLPVEDDDDGKEGGPRTLEVTIDFRDGPPVTEEFIFEDCAIHDVDYEIRVFHLQRRQPYRIKVDTAREYLNRFGGVHVYDAGFHLPYYGPQTDWLGIEMDHSHRLSESKLLPKELQVGGGLSFLPTNSRLYGVVNVDTAEEQRVARTRGRAASREALSIQVSRDRLVGSEAYKHLRMLVRFSLDLYAMREAERVAREIAAEGENEPVPVKLARVEEVLEGHRAEIPKPVYSALRHEIRRVLEAAESEAEIAAHQAGLLGALATAGISAVAYEHEFNRQLGALDRLAQRLGRASAAADPEAVAELAAELKQTIKGARETRKLFSHLIDAESREERRSLRAREMAREVASQVRFALRGVDLHLDGIADGLRLPPGRFAEWSALFQNLYVNAANAMLDSAERRIAVTSRKVGPTQAIYVQDTGTGVDLDTADELFEPFARRQAISPERERLGLGGSGMGLTIARMIATNLGCRLAFTKPDDGYATAVRISWR